MGSNPTPRTNLPVNFKALVDIEVGDVSHSCGVEVITSYPDWAERNEEVLGETKDLLRNSFYEKGYLKRPDYVRYGSMRRLRTSDEAHAKLTAVFGRLMAETGKMET